MATRSGTDSWCANMASRAHPHGTAYMLTRFGCQTRLYALDALKSPFLTALCHLGELAKLLDDRHSFLPWARPEARAHFAFTVGPRKFGRSNRPDQVQLGMYNVSYQFQWFGLCLYWYVSSMPWSNHLQATTQLPYGYMHGVDLPAPHERTPMSPSYKHNIALVPGP